MHKLTDNQFEIARPLFSYLSQYNVSIDAVLSGTYPGEVWVDNLDNPRVSYLSGCEGSYLSGDPDYIQVHDSLKEIISPQAYLHIHPDGWESYLDKIWGNSFARRHPRRHMLFCQAKLTHYQDLIPEGFVIALIDQKLLNRRELVNHEAVSDWIAGWHSTEYFFEHGFGFCILYEKTIASWTITDCVAGKRCEIGIQSDPGFRRRGLAALVVAAAVDYAIEKGFQHIGWHCHSSNAGSIAVAEKVGFVTEREYFALSSFLPAENIADLTPEQYADWAEHYEEASQVQLGYAYQAAAAWALSGKADRSIKNLHRLLNKGWIVQHEWLEKDWRYTFIRENATFQALLHQLKEAPDLKAEE